MTRASRELMVQFMIESDLGSENMPASDLFTTITNVAYLVGELDRSGISVEIGDDFLVFRRLRNNQKDRSAMYPMFDVASSYVDASNAFWICGFNKDNELIHTQAVRLLDLGDDSLAQHLRNHRHKYITPGSTPNPDNTFFASLPVLDNICGRAGYHGEFWIKAGTIGRRNIGLTAVLSRIAFEMSMKLWSPDFLFGFVPTQMATRGVSVRYGYTHCELGAWHGPEQEVTSEEMLVWMSNEDLRVYLGTKPRQLGVSGLKKTRGSSARAVDKVA